MGYLVPGLSEGPWVVVLDGPRPQVRAAGPGRRTATGVMTWPEL